VNIRLDTADAMELAQLLDLLRDWLSADRTQLSASLERFIGSPAYNVETLPRRPRQLRAPARRQRRRALHQPGGELTAIKRGKIITRRELTATWQQRRCRRTSHCLAPLVILKSPCRA
jgi:hypothetical protein